jgi:hypothetical protein
VTAAAKACTVRAPHLNIVNAVHKLVGWAGLGLGDVLLALRVHIITELSRGSLALTSASAPPLLRPIRPLLGSDSPCRLTCSADCEPNDPNLTL